jgi:hypothetical protein
MDDAFDGYESHPEEYNGKYANMLAWPENDAGDDGRSLRKDTPAARGETAV